MSTDIEQYRPGFEAAYPFAKEVRDDIGGYQGVMGIRWETWIAAKREASTESAKPAFGCHCDLEPGMEPDGCVIDSGRREDCVYSRKVATKEQCVYWQPIKGPTGALTDEAKSAARDEALEEAAQIAAWFGPSRPIVSRNPGALIQGRWEGEQAASEGIAAEIRRRKSTAAIAHTKAQEGQ